MSRKNCEKCNGTGTVWHWGEIKGADSDSPCPDCSWGVWNVTLKCWLLGPAMSRVEAQKAAGEWNARAADPRNARDPRNTFEAKRESA